MIDSIKITRIEIVQETFYPAKFITIIEYDGTLQQTTLNARNTELESWRGWADTRNFFTWLDCQYSFIEKRNRYNRVGRSKVEFFESGSRILTIWKIDWKKEIQFYQGLYILFKNAGNRYKISMI